MAGRFEISTSIDEKFFFNLKAGNGQVTLTSELYETEDGASKGIASVRANSAIDERYERKTTSAGKWHFNLKTANGQVIGRSEMYSSETAMENGIASVKVNAPEALIVELTDA
ncbi:MAG: YegP family protein [Blastocatellia bacterium]